MLPGVRSNGHERGRSFETARARQIGFDVAAESRSAPSLRAKSQEVPDDDPVGVRRALATVTIAPFKAGLLFHQLRVCFDWPCASWRDSTHRSDASRQAFSVAR